MYDSIQKDDLATESVILLIALLFPDKKIGRHYYVASCKWLKFLQLNDPVAGSYGQRRLTVGLI